MRAKMSHLNQDHDGGSVQRISNQLFSRKTRLIKVMIFVHIDLIQNNNLNMFIMM